MSNNNMNKMIKNSYNKIKKGTNNKWFKLNTLIWVNKFTDNLVKLLII